MDEFRDAVQDGVDFAALLAQQQRFGPRGKDTHTSRVYTSPREEAEIWGSDQGPVQVAAAQIGSEAAAIACEGAVNERGEGSNQETSTYKHHQSRCLSYTTTPPCGVLLKVFPRIFNRSIGSYVCSAGEIRQSSNIH